MISGISFKLKEICVNWDNLMNLNQNHYWGKGKQKLLIEDAKNIIPDLAKKINIILYLQQIIKFAYINQLFTYLAHLLDKKPTPYKKRQ